MPAHIALLFLSPRAPELNLVESTWQFLRDNWLSNRICNDYDNTVAHCCEAWKKPVGQLWKIISIGEAPSPRDLGSIAIVRLSKSWTL